MGQHPVLPDCYVTNHSPFNFSLVDDDFGVQYELQDDIKHLLDALKTVYNISKYWEGKLYCAITLYWNYHK